MVLETQRRHKSLVGTSFNGCPAFELLAAGEADWRHCAGDTSVKARYIAEEGFAGLQLSSCGSTRGVYEAHAALVPACLHGHLERPPEIMILKFLTPSGFYLDQPCRFLFYSHTRALSFITSEQDPSLGGDREG
jgi:hypothetical protein